MGINSHIIDISQVHKADEDLVGKKAHELGMLWKLGIPLPDGFVITTQFQKQFLYLTGIDKEIKKTQNLKHPSLSNSFDKLFYPVQKKIMHIYIPQVLLSELHKFYRQFSGIFKDNSFNIFSSSSNNKFIFFPNVKGDANLVLKIKTIWSLFPEELVAIVIQENINSKIKGKILTDNPTFDKKLTEEQTNKLTNYCKIIQKHFYFPKEIEYSVEKDKIFITQINPFTDTIAKPTKPIHKNSHMKKTLIKGISINPGIVTGPVKIFQNNVEIKSGDVVALHDLNSFLYPKLKKAKAVIIDSALSNSLDKALYREYLKIPTIEAAKNATKIFQNGNVITVNGMTGKIYSGGLV